MCVLRDGATEGVRRGAHAPAAPPTCVGEASAEEAHEGLDRWIDKFHALQPARGAYVAAMGPIASLRSLWTFPHIRRMGSPRRFAHEVLRISAIQTGTSAVRATRQRD
jgi:hypothetical protein